MRCLYNGVHPCGKCPACLANRQRGFVFRLDQEKDKAKFFFWLTLQYDEDHVPRLDNGEYCFSKTHCREFFERLRKKFHTLTFKHFLVSEYGPNSTHRPHYHCLLLVYNDLSLAQNYLLKQELKDFILHKAWPHGFVCEKSYHGRVLSYLTKYCCKPELIGEYHTMKPFTLISRGIGTSYIENMTPEQLKSIKEDLNFEVMYNGKLTSLPRYLVDKIVPHSKKLIDDALLSGDYDEYSRLQAIREKISRVNNHLTQKRAYKIQRNFERDPNSFFREYRSFKSNIDQNMAEFKSKILKRKNL